MKTLRYLIFLLLIPCFAWAGIVASGSVTQANAKKSLVDGAAFIDILPSDYLVASWPLTTDYMEDATHVSDVAGTNHGAVTGAVVGSESTYFDGTGDKIDCSNDSSLNLTSAITISAWIYRTGSGGDRHLGVVCKGGYSPTVGYSFRFGYSNDLRFGVGDGATFQSPSAMSIGTDTWHHIVGTFDGSIIRTYYNNTAGPTLVYEGAIDPGVADVFIGSDGGSRVFIGQISDVQIFDKALSPTEVTNLYNVGRYTYAHADSGDHKHIFKLIDSSNKVAWGYVGASGGGETLGGELHTDANAASDPNGNEADATTGWTQASLDVGANVFDSVEVAGDTGTYSIQGDSEDTPTNNARFYKDIETDWSLLAGQLIKLTFDIRHVGSGGSWDFRLGDTITGVGNSITVINILNTETTFQTLSHNFTYSSNDYYKYIVVREIGNNDGGVYLDNLSAKQVTDCSTNGLHILSTKSGSVQNWAEIEAGFLYNDPSGYTYEIKDIGKGHLFW